MIKSIGEIISTSVDKMWPMLTIFLVVIASVRIAAVKSNNEKLIFYKEFSYLLFIVYILLLYEMFRYPIGSKGFYFNVVGNIVMFIPFGYLISTYIKPKRILPILIVSALTSTTVEFVQSCIGRSFDVDDILLNVVGALIGFLLYVSFNAIKKFLPGIFQNELFYNILSIIVLILIVLYVLSRMGVNIV